MNSIIQLSNTTGQPCWITCYSMEKCWGKQYWGVIPLMEIYPVNNAIYLLNNWGLGSRMTRVQRKSVLQLAIRQSYLSCTSPKVISTSSPQNLDEQDWLQFFCIIWIPKKLCLPVGQSEQNSLARQQNPLATSYRTQLSLHADNVQHCLVSLDKKLCLIFF